MKKRKAIMKIVVVFALFVAVVIPSSDGILATQAEEVVLYSLEINAEGFNAINAQVCSTLLHILTHDGTGVIVTYSIIQEFMPQNFQHPDISFNQRNGVLTITQEAGAEIRRFNRDILDTTTMAFRGTNVRHSNPMTINGRWVDFSVDVCFDTLVQTYNIALEDTGIITIYLPHNFVLDRLEVGTQSGAVWVMCDKENITIRSINMETESGVLKLLGITALENAYMRTISGYIGVRDGIFNRNLLAMARFGRIVILDTSIERHLTAYAQDGTIILRNVDADLENAYISRSMSVDMFSNPLIESIMEAFFFPVAR